MTRPVRAPPPPARRRLRPADRVRGRGDAAGPRLTASHPRNWIPRPSQRKVAAVIAPAAIHAGLRASGGAASVARSFGSYQRGESGEEGGAAERGRRRRDEHQLPADRIERAGDAGQDAAGEIGDEGQSPGALLALGEVAPEKLFQLADDHGERPEGDGRAHQRESDARRDLETAALDDLVPVAEPDGRRHHVRTDLVAVTPPFLDEADGETGWTDGTERPRPGRRTRTSSASGSRAAPAW